MNEGPQVRVFDARGIADEGFSLDIVQRIGFGEIIYQDFPMLTAPRKSADEKVSALIRKYLSETFISSLARCEKDG